MGGGRCTSLLIQLLALIQPPDPGQLGERLRTYDVMLRVRVNEETDRLVREAAESAARRKGSGDVSSWVREILTAAARRELREGGGLRTAAGD